MKLTKKDIGKKIYLYSSMMKDSIRHGKVVGNMPSFPGDPEPWCVKIFFKDIKPVYVKYSSDGTCESSHTKLFRKEQRSWESE